MNRIDRLSAILIMLQTKKIITAAEIADRFEISIRTVYRDIRALDEAGVPIGAEAGKGYYLVEGYSLPPVMFTSEEAGALLLAGKLVNSFSDSSTKHYYNLAVDKIKSVLPESHRDFLEQLDNQVQVFNPSDSQLSNNFISSIQKALSERKCLKIKYNAQYNQSSSERMVEPLGLCFYSFKWHLIAYCKLRNDYRDFRVDRIQDLSVQAESCTHTEKLSISEYFSQMWSNQELFNVVVKFETDFAPVISGTRYYYGFYEETIHQEYAEMKFAVNEYNYIANWLITLGNPVIDIHPGDVKEIVLSHVRALSEKYL